MHSVFWLSVFFIFIELVFSGMLKWENQVRVHKKCVQNFGLDVPW